MIVVTTPTGQIGREVVTGLLDAAVSVRVIARDPAALAPAVRERVEVVQGSHADPAVLKEACEGAEGVFWLSPPNFAADSVERHFRAFTAPLVETIGVEDPFRVVAVSTLGRGVARNAGLVSASLSMDEAIAATGVRYRALCAPFLMENLLSQAASVRDTGTLSLPLVPDHVLRLCAVRDIGATAVSLLLDGTWTGQEDVPLASPDDLTPEGMAGVLGEVFGRPVSVRYIPSAENKALMTALGASEAWAQGYADMVDAQNEQHLYGASQVPTPDRAPTTFRRWCEEVLRPAAER
ncbi:NmrA family NAD(P)-binding protein [Streptomyces sp. T028]|uniref:NmrA family NAD(P)-binding protein n=1 Tax=Streptomyces sp. T028 TaxID=3394379 RepID=UPI003A862D8A